MLKSFYTVKKNKSEKFYKNNVKKQLPVDDNLYNNNFKHTLSSLDYNLFNKKSTGYDFLLQKSCFSNDNSNNTIFKELLTTSYCKSIDVYNTNLSNNDQFNDFKNSNTSNSSSVFNKDLVYDVESNKIIEEINKHIVANQENDLDKKIYVSDTNVDITNIDVSNIDVSNIDISNIDVSNIDISNIDISNIDISNIDISNIDITNVDGSNNLNLNKEYFLKLKNKSAENKLESIKLDPNFYILKDDYNTPISNWEIINPTDYDFSDLKID